MCFNKKSFLSYLTAILIAVFVLSGAAYSQFSVTITSSATSIVPETGSAVITVNVTQTGTENLAKLVIYRNDVPYQTFDGTSYTRIFTETELGQDTYTYRARAYGALQSQIDSGDIKLTVDFPPNRVFKMGGWIGPPNQPGSVDAPGPGRTTDHTPYINAALIYISNTGGGVLYFPCNGGQNGNDISIYNIGGTINVPSNVTLQGESAKNSIIDASCRMYWTADFTGTGCWDPTNNSQLQGKAMFEIAGNARRVRLKDLFMVTRYRGRECGEEETTTRIFNYDNTAIMIKALTPEQTNTEIKDIILENVSMSWFKYGIKAIGDSISDVKMRGVTPSSNYRQLHIDATYAYDWDVQNFNMNGMLTDQGAVEIVNAGAPALTPPERKPLKFLQLNCNGDFTRTADFCMSIEKHGGIYLKQLHIEGSKNGILVRDIGTRINEEPIILEHSSVVGQFRDDSMKLYLIGSTLPAAPDPETVWQTPVGNRHIDTQLMEFYGAGQQSTVVDCGDLHGDRTDVRATFPNSTSRPGWNDWKMQFTHSERNRESLFSLNATTLNGTTLDDSNNFFPKPHTVCPANTPGLPNINEVGGHHFNTGVIPVTKDSRYTHQFSCPASPLNTPSFCAAQLNLLLNNTPNGGAVQINGIVKVDTTINVPNGKQIVGGEDAELILEPNGSQTGRVDLLRIMTPTRVENGVRVPYRMSHVTIRDLKLSTNQITNTSGIAIVGTDYTNITGVSSDLHFSGLVIQGFDKGVDVRRFGASYLDQMVDGVSWKNIRFINNQTAAKVVPQNVSNWNIIDLAVESAATGAVGWHQVSTGNSIQNVTCSGTEDFPMSDCIKMEMGGTHLSGLKKTDYVINNLTFAPNSRYFGEQYQAPVFSFSVLRDNDFRGKGDDLGAVNFSGKALLTSMNNRYKKFTVVAGTADQGEFSRVTYCNDTFDNGTAFQYLADHYNDLYVGVNLPTRIKCDKSNDLNTLAPKPWKDVVRLGDEPRTDSNPTVPFKADKPMTGNLLGSAAQELVIYREAQYSEFRIKKFDGTDKATIPWGTQHDIPFIGKFYTSSLDQPVIWRPSSGQWWIYNSVTNTSSTIPWGLQCAAPYTNCDIPFVGNFIDESGTQGDNLNEIGIYRPDANSNNYSLWILNPRSGTYVNLANIGDKGSKIQIGDFLGLGFDQIALLRPDNNNNLVWNIVNPRSPYNNANIIFGTTGDVPVSGKYLPGSCAQLGVWRPSTEEFIVTDADLSCNNSATVLRTKTMKWGSNNDSTYTGATTDQTECIAGICPDDIPLRIDLGDGVHRPTSYRPTSGIYPKSKAKGQWWIHDPFLPN